MYRFEEFERLGLRSGMTERTDGDAENAITALLPNLVRLKQVHGTTIVRGEDARTMKERPEADGATIAEPGIPIGVSVADCVPILLYDPVARCAAAVHAGRRGLELGIGGAGVDALSRRGADASQLHAAIGPSAGPCCYEVSAEMAAYWASLALPLDGRMLDLWEAAAQQLVSRGVPREQIHLSGICTICTDRFYSYRRGDDRPRNLAFVVL